MLDTFITYKAEWKGKNVIHIPQFEPTTKVCSNCGFINNMLTLADREWVCPACAARHQRDTNAAIVIKNIGLKQVSGPGRPTEPMEPNQRFGIEIGSPLL
jgi:putative transposase